MKEQRLIFQERLTDLKEYAADHNDILTKDEIRDFFGDTPLEDEHFRLIFEYLKGQRILIADTQEEADEARESGTTGSLSFYLSDLAENGCLSHLDENGESVLQPGEELDLFRRMAAGDQAAREHLIEIYLPVVCQIADEYEGDEITVEDLIQEGNLGLLTSLAELEADASLAACQACLLNGINKAMQAAIDESHGQKEKGRVIADKVNHLNDAVHTMEDELEHKISVDELSAYLEMPVEEIQDILRMAGDEIDVIGKQ